jgi:hypothetical protein
LSKIVVNISKHFFSRIGVYFPVDPEHTHRLPRYLKITPPFLVLLDHRIKKCWLSKANISYHGIIQIFRDNVKQTAYPVACSHVFWDVTLKVGNYFFQMLLLFAPKNSKFSYCNWTCNVGGKETNLFVLHFSLQQMHMSLESCQILC